MADGHMLFDVDGSASRLYLADEAGLDATGDIEIRLDLALDDWSPTSTPRNLVDRWVTTGNHRVFRVRVEGASGAIVIYTGQSDGTSRSGNWQLDWDADLPADGARRHLRITIDADDGGATTVKLYARAAGDGDDLESDTGWTEIDTASQSGVQTFQASSNAPVAINNQSEAGGTGASVAMGGKFYRVIAWGDLTKTSKLWDVDFRTDDSVTGTTWDDNIRTGHWAMQGTDIEWVAPTGASFPDAPVGLTADPISPNQIDLEWEALTGADAYDIERDGVIIETGHLTTTYSDTGLTPNTEYDYRVRGTTA